MKISVALCTYNGEHFLHKQLDSILNQSTPVHEIVVCDDISSDNTKSILESYSSKYPGLFHIHYNDKNLRSNKNFEKALKLTTGDYIFFSDQDDLWKVDKVEKVLQVFKNNPTAEGVFTDADLIDDDDNIIYENVSLWESVNFYEQYLPKPVDLHKLLMCKGNYLTGATLCVKKEVKDFCFSFKTLEKTFLHDEYFALILSERNTLFYSTEKLISYRLHSNQQMGVGKFNTKKHNSIKDLPRGLGLMLDVVKPKTFKDYKILTRSLFSQYEKFMDLHKTYNLFDKNFTNKLLEMYIEADLRMKKSNPLLYFFRKRKDKKKGKRQLN